MVGAVHQNALLVASGLSAAEDMEIMRNDKQYWLKKQTNKLDN